MTASINENPEIKTGMRITPLFTFLLPVFIYFITDGIMAYVFPIIVEERLNSNFLMGIIMSLSSVVGVICDFSFPVIFRNKGWRFELILGTLLVFAFPLSVLLSEYFAPVLMFLIASSVWGVYFELILFAENSFVGEEEKGKDLVWDWSVILAVTYVSSLFAPVVGSLLLGIDLVLAMTIVLTIHGVAFLASIFSSKKIALAPIRRGRESRILKSLNLLVELRSWDVLWKRTTPMLIMKFILEIVEAAYWTLGGLFGLTLIKNDDMGWLPMLLYIVPMILGSVILSRIQIKNGKKKLSQYCLLFGGMALLPLYFVFDSPVIILVFIFLSGLGFAIAKPLNYAVGSELMNRLGKSKEDLMGLQSALGSLAFIIGPILVGYIADLIGYQLTFASVGGLAIFAAIYLRFITPKKIKLPQKELSVIAV